MRLRQDEAKKVELTSQRAPVFRDTEGGRRKTCKSLSKGKTEVDLIKMISNMDNIIVILITYHWHHCRHEIPASQKKTQMTLPFLLYKHTQVTTRPPIQQTCSEGSLHNHQSNRPVPRALYNIEPCLRHGRFQSHLGNLPPENVTIVDHAVSNIFYSINLPLLMSKIIKIIEVVSMMAAVIGQLLSLLGLAWLTWQK